MRQHVWLINMFFGTGVAPTGVLLESLALGLQQRGYSVEVLTGHSRYNAARADVERRFTGLVRRLPCGPIHPKGFAGRLLSWFIFYLSLFAFVFSRRLPAIVVVMTTPPFMHAVFVLRNRLARHRAHLIVWNQDTYPEILATVGLVDRSSWRYRMLSSLERFGVSRADDVIVLDRAMKTLLEDHGGRRIHVVPNWEVQSPNGEAAGSGFPERGTAQAVDDLSRVIREARARFRRLVLYIGNYGWGHDLSPLLDWIEQHPDQRDWFFLFTGGGEKWSELQRFVAASRSVCIEVRPYAGRKARVNEVIADSDYGLVNLTENCVGLMAPSKIHSYLALGKPLLYIGPPGSNVADAIASYQCGVQIDEHDAAGLAAWLGRSAGDDAGYAAMSRRAATAARARYAEAIGVPDVVAVLEAGPRP